MIARSDSYRICVSINKINVLDSNYFHLQNQLTRVKSETRQLRQTDIGRVFKDYKSVSKWAEYPMAEMNYETANAGEIPERWLKAQDKIGQ